MSCFESSTFRQNLTVMQHAPLLAALHDLNWTFQEEGEVIRVSGQRYSRVKHKDYWLFEVKNTEVTYKSRFFRGSRAKVGFLDREMSRLRVAYARMVVLRAYFSRNFLLEPVNSIADGSSEVADRFNVVAYSLLKDETEKEVKIQFEIHKDGTVVSDSNYIPRDVHDLADEAMEEIDAAFGTERREGIEIKRKAIPIAYADKAFCAPKHASLQAAAAAH